MTTIGAGQFNISPFEKPGITVTNKKMTDEEIEKFKKLQQQGASQTGAAASALLPTPIAVKGAEKTGTDYSSLEKDRARVEGSVATPQTKLAAQTIGSEDAAPLAAETPSAADEFLDFTAKSWEERMRVMILKSMGLTEDDVNAMSAEEREKLEAKIKEKIDEEIEKKTGMNPTSAASAIATA